VEYENDVVLPSYQDAYVILARKILINASIQRQKDEKQEQNHDSQSHAADVHFLVALPSALTILRLFPGRSFEIL
jgi:hypothetical protein